MKEITIKSLIWNKWNREHIKKHHLIPRQAEQVLHDQNKLVGRGYQGRIKLYGRCGKRLVVLLLSPEGKKFYVVTARDMDKREREFYRSRLSST